MFDLLREDCPEQWEKKKEQTAATGIGCFSICERICTAKSKWQCRGPITTEYKALTDAQDEQKDTFYQLGKQDSTGFCVAVSSSCCFIDEGQCQSPGAELMRWQQVMGKEILGEKRNEIT